MEHKPYPDTGGHAQPRARDAQPQPADGLRPRPISMHEGIADWCDCCSCEAEPYWIAVADELGIDRGSDYEDGRAHSRERVTSGPGGRRGVR